MRRSVGTMWCLICSALIVGKKGKIIDFSIHLSATSYCAPLFGIEQRVIILHWLSQRALCPLALAFASAHLTTA